MLQRVLQEMATARGPLSLDELSRRLGVERETLDGMVETLVRMGRLRDDRQALLACGAHCSGCATDGACADAVQGPRTYSLVAPTHTEGTECA
jgi:hypothetical protein